MALIRYALRTQAAWDAMLPADQAVYAAHYADIASWQAAEARDLTATGDVAQLDVFDDWAGGLQLNDLTFLASWITSAADHITICAAPGHEALGRPDAGARLVCSSTTEWAVFLNKNGSHQHCTFSDIGILSAVLNGYIAYFPSDNWRFARCVIDGDYCAFAFPKTNVFDSCILSATGFVFLGASWSAPAMLLDNCVLNAKAGNTEALLDGSTDVIVRNTAFIGFSDTNQVDVLSPASTNNATTSAAAPHSSFSVTGVVAVNDFVDAANGDYHLAAGSVLEGAGANLYDGTGGQLDIDLDPWPATGSWNIGADTPAVAAGIVADGDVTASDAAATGSAVKTVTASGGVVAGVASSSGQATKAAVATGAVTASPTSVSGSASVISAVTATGAATAGDASASGAATKTVLTEGAATAQQSHASGAAVAPKLASGAASASGAIASGSASVASSVEAAGSVTADVASSSGAAAVVRVAAGVVSAPPASASGSGWKIVTAVGAVVAETNASHGEAVRRPTATGSVYAPAATAAGAASIGGEYATIGIAILITAEKPEIVCLDTNENNRVIVRRTASSIVIH